MRWPKMPPDENVLRRLRSAHLAFRPTVTVAKKSSGVMDAWVTFGSAVSTGLMAPPSAGMLMFCAAESRTSKVTVPSLGFIDVPARIFFSERRHDALRLTAGSIEPSGYTVLTSDDTALNVVLAAPAI